MLNVIVRSSGVLLIGIHVFATLNSFFERRLLYYRQTGSNPKTKG